MWCGIVTLFPEMFKALTDYGITRRAVERGLLELHYWDPRDFSTDPHHSVDDRPYGGGPGMVMGVYPLRHAIIAARKAAGDQAKVIYLSPQGQKLSQERIRQAAADSARFVFVAGRYEGVDERLVTLEVDEEWSIGDYVLSGGELAIMVVLDAITRWVPGALGDKDSALLDSFSEGLLDCPHYTRPEVVDGLQTPAVLLSGNHAEILKWRLKQKLGRTWLRRKDLLGKLDLSLEQQKLLKEFIEETNII
ncbi:MAG TPA: tRNA (guanosine(37)-N1)-methyltransferase TrmD [Gammaproteobacteria bacterium]|nr:tRNA (guanosine(37)-N1)-methyltransferase TrmD [Gammaproteobacteria bacterium]HRA43029.1 tRNA (guanosine(37)-N1)-methyltransferase TrmD [Gammaproteobacteria bacterium]